MTVREIKEMSNAQLIETLCYCSEKETKSAYKIGQQIIKELKNRQIINQDDVIKFFVD